MMFLHWQIASALIAVILLVHDIFLANRDGRQ